ncbi:MAG: c-type cytochrome [Thermoanaerobaculia bacterium]
MRARFLILIMILIMAIALTTACNRPERPPRISAPPSSSAGDAARGKQLIEKYACNSCHVIPTIEGPKGSIGPSLAHVGSRPTVGGKLANTPENVSKWLQNPQAIDPENTMPNLGITPAESQDLAAFLATLR